MLLLRGPTDGIDTQLDGTALVGRGRGEGPRTDMTSVQNPTIDKKRNKLLRLLDEKYGATPSPTASGGGVGNNSGDGNHAATPPRPLFRSHLGVQVAEVDLARVQIPSCSHSNCTAQQLQERQVSSKSASPSGQAQKQTSSSVFWCSFPVVIEEVDWSAYRDSLQAQNTKNEPKLPPGLSFQVVDRESDLGPAIKKLKSSMKDRMLAIDMEWCPEGLYGVKPNESKVALIQLASGSHCLLIRISAMKFRLPDALKSLFDDPNIIFCSLGWATADEKMLQRTFSRGWRDFGGGRGHTNFIDVQDLAVRFGYVKSGLAGLTHHVLGFKPAKSRKVSTSNWAAPSPLRPQQLMYAAMDAFLTGSICRALRSWHAAPTHCQVIGCSSGPLGWPSALLALAPPSASAAPPPLPIQAGTPGTRVCSGCGRLGLCSTSHPESDSHPDGAIRTSGSAADLAALAAQNGVSKSQKRKLKRKRAADKRKREGGDEGEGGPGNAKKLKRTVEMVGA